MKKSMSVHKCQSLQYLKWDFTSIKFLAPKTDRFSSFWYLISHISDNRFRKMPFPIFDQLIQIFFHILEHEIQNVIFAYHFFQLDHIGVTQLFQRLKSKQLKPFQSSYSFPNVYLNFSEIHRLFPRIVFPLHAFNSDLFPGVPSLAQNHTPISPIP